MYSTKKQQILKKSPIKRNHVYTNLHHRSNTCFAVLSSDPIRLCPFVKLDLYRLHHLALTKISKFIQLRQSHCLR